MIIEYQIEIVVGARNFPKLRSKFPNISKNSKIVLNSQDLHLIPQNIKLQCVCNECHKKYIQSVKRLLQKPIRQNFCGDCCHKIGSDNMRQTLKTEGFRKQRSKTLKEYYQTDAGKETIKRTKTKRRETVKDPKYKEIWVKNLKHFFGENHPNFNPDKSKFKEYAYQVRLLSEKVYANYMHIINPHNYPRTLCGVDGGYQLDHVKSIKECFEQDMSPEDAANLTNLQMLPWKNNRTKWYDK